MAAGIGMDAGQREADLVSGTSVQVMETQARREITQVEAAHQRAEPEG